MRRLGRRKLQQRSNQPCTCRVCGCGRVERKVRLEIGSGGGGRCSGSLSRIGLSWHDNLGERAGIMRRRLRSAMRRRWSQLHVTGACLSRRCPDVRYSDNIPQGSFVCYCYICLPPRINDNASPRPSPPPSLPRNNHPPLQRI
jgi:hypothetical protein